MKLTANSTNTTLRYDSADRCTTGDTGTAPLYRVLLAAIVLAFTGKLPT